jgi:hypothetical protein
VLICVLYLLLVQCYAIPRAVGGDDPVCGDTALPNSVLKLAQDLSFNTVEPCFSLFQISNVILDGT